MSHRPRFGALPQAGTDEGRPSKELLPGTALSAPVFWTSTFKNCQTTEFSSVWNQPVPCYTIYDYYGLKDTDSRQSIFFWMLMGVCLDCLECKLIAQVVEKILMKAFK